MRKEKSMTGHEIAENLRHTDIPWGVGRFHKVRDDKHTYCVLGIKAKEAGASDAQLDYAAQISLFPDEPDYASAWSINDSGNTKEKAIELFDSLEWRDVNFPIEPWIKEVLALKV